MNIYKNYLLEPTSCCLFENRYNQDVEKQNCSVQIFEIESEFQKNTKLEVANYSMIINKDTTFLQISKNLYYYKAADNNYPLAIEIFQSVDKFNKILKEVCDLQQANEVTRQQIFNSQSMSQNLETGGQKLGGVIENIGKYIGSGIESAGNQLAQKVKPNEKETEINPKIKNGLKTVHVIVSTAATYTTAMVGAGLDVVKNVGGEVIKNLPENETVNKIKKHDNYEDAKNIGLGAVKGTANVIGGIFNGVVNIASGIGKATQNVVTQKYGSQAGEVVQDSREIIKGAVKIDYSIKNAIVQDLKSQPQDNPQLK